MELREIGSHAVFEHEAVVTTVIGFADCGVDADFRGDAGDDELFDAAMLKDCVQIGGVKRALAGLVDHRLSGHRVELRDDVVPGFAAHQNSAHRPDIADGGGAASANLLGRRQIGEVGPMALARMHHEQPRGSPRRQEALIGLDRAAQLRDIVAEHLAKTARLKKISLHVDDQQRAMLRRQLEGVGFSRDVDEFFHPVAPPKKGAPRLSFSPRGAHKRAVAGGTSTFCSGRLTRSNNHARCVGSRERLADFPVEVPQAFGFTRAATHVVALAKRAIRRHNIFELPFRLIDP